MRNDSNFVSVSSDRNKKSRVILMILAISISRAVSKYLQHFEIHEIIRIIKQTKVGIIGTDSNGIYFSSFEIGTGQEKSLTASPLILFPTCIQIFSQQLPP